MNNATWIRIAFLLLAMLTAEVSLAQPTFINKIPIPPLIDADTGTINLEMRITRHRFNPGNPFDSINGGANQPDGIFTYAYNVAGDSTMTILGPTLKWHTLENTSIRVKNLIGAPTTTHWHGAEVPAEMDGGPHQGIMPGETWPVSFNTLDSASTLWYHPHYHNTTVEQVQKGLSGMIIVEQPGDPIWNMLPHTYGVDDIPVVVGDIGFTGSASDSLFIDSAKGHRPYNLINGVTNPYVEVPAHMVRLRILNGSTRKGIMFGVSGNYANPISDMRNFRMIASDGGYLLNPVDMLVHLSGPGAREEIVLDLTEANPGDILYLSNLKALMPYSIVGSPQPRPGGSGSGTGAGKDTTGGTAFLELRIVHDSAFKNYTPINSMPSFTTTWTPGLSDTSMIARHRLKELVPISAGYSIDGTPYDMMRIDDTVCVNTKEIWAVKNLSNVAHPFHIHKIQFRVLDVTDSLGNNIDLEPLGLNGPKDDVLVLPGWTMRFLGQFDDYPSPIAPMNCYMYHCHILTHEDAIGGGMMHQFVVTDQGACISSSVAEAESESAGMILIANPTEGTLRLRGTSAQISRVTLFDVKGRTVREQELPALDGDVLIDVANLYCGLYLVEWQTEEGVRTGKVMLR